MNRADVVHAAGPAPKAYCGRNTREQTTDWELVTCEDCHAAHRADKAAS